MAPACITLVWMISLNQSSPKEIAGSDITNCLTHSYTKYAIAFKATWRVMQALEVWADTKSCQDISCIFKDYLVTNVDDKHMNYLW